MSGTDPGAPAAFTTVAGRGEATISVRGSRFIGYTAPAASPQVAEAFITGIQDDHPDSTHVVPAYRVRTADGFLREQASDAGEPSGSAGKPILRLLQKRNLEGVVVVVVRYFGGVELGVGGLARAYGEAAKRAVAAAGTDDRLPHRRIVIDAEYDDSGTVRGILESEELEVDATYAEQVQFTVAVPVGKVEALIERLRSATSDRIDIETA